MFAVIYKFKVRQGQDKKFKESWKALTQLIYKHEGSLGSRLHKSEGQLYIAYAQWPDKETWEKSGSKLPKSADAVRMAMRESCEEIKTEYQLEIADDLLKSDLNKNSRKEKTPPMAGPNHG